MVWDIPSSKSESPFSILLWSRSCYVGHGTTHSTSKKTPQNPAVWREMGGSLRLWKDHLGVMEPDTNGSLMYFLFEKIRKCRMDLIAWSRATFGNTRTHLEEKQKELTTLMEAGYGQNVERIHGLKKEINELLHHKKVFWRQRSRSIWLPARDKNTKFFHQRMSQRRRKNNIVGLYDGEGEWHTDEDKIASIAEEFYK